ncbi:MAG: GNAT family N-acetyltransferase, partial [Acidimicrobiales bacterium]
MTVVETERLRLRPWSGKDLDALADIFARPEVWRYPFGRAFTREESEEFLLRQLDHWDAHGFGSWAAELRPGGDLIGYIGLAVPTWLPQILPAVEVGWRLHPHHWGQGLATEGGRASLDHGFDTLGLDRIVAIYMRENVASARVMDKLGMREWTTTTDPERGTALVVREITRA